MSSADSVLTAHGFARGTELTSIDVILIGHVQTPCQWLQEF